MLSRLLRAALLLAVIVHSADALTYTNQFKNWYPQSSWQYEAYLTGDKAHATIDRIGGGGPYSVLTQPVIQCILSNSSEYVKAQIACSQVLLGIAPSILAMIGPSTDETAFFLLMGRRQLLFLLLAVGSPTVYFSRAFEYPEPTWVFSDRDGRLSQAAPHGAKRLAIAALEYAFAFGAAANIALVCYELGIRTICTFMTDWIFGPMLWAALGILVHIGGALLLRQRIRRLDPTETGTEAEIGLLRWVLRLPQRILGMLRTELDIGVSQPDIRIKVFPETPLYITLSWLLSTGTICHILFGTLIFSSTIFIGTLDGLGVVGRYMASVMVCRIIVMYELSGLRNSYIAMHGSGKKGCSCEASSNKAETEPCLAAPSDRQLKYTKTLSA